MSGPSIQLPKIPPRPKCPQVRAVSPYQRPSPLNEPPTSHDGTVDVEELASGASTIPVSFTPSNEQIKGPLSMNRLPSVGQEGKEYESLMDAVEKARNGELNPEKDKETLEPKIVIADTDGSTKIMDTAHNPFYQTSQKYGSKFDPSELQDCAGCFGDVGIQIPLYPNAGEVQAPTPETVPGLPAGILAPICRKKNRGDPFDAPPGSYGLHGHGVPPTTEMEKKWYEKHPEERAREPSHGPSNPQHWKEWHMSSADLNKLVHITSCDGSSKSHTIPDEQVGILAAEQYAMRISQESHRADQSGKLDREFCGSNSSSRDLNQSNGKETDVIHVDSDDGIPVVEGSNELEIHPILAADELAKHPTAEHLRPAVTPDPDRVALENECSSLSSSTTRTTQKHPSARPANPIIAPEILTHQLPLEDVPEYEPLFSEDDEDIKKAKEARNAEVSKRIAAVSAARHAFPSKDVWEDSPSSYHLKTVVKVQSPTEQGSDEVPDRHLRELERVREERRMLQLSEISNQAILPGHLERLAASTPCVLERWDEMLSEHEEGSNQVKIAFKSESTIGEEDNVRRSGIAIRGHNENDSSLHGISRAPHKFPSKDIWEDAAESQRLFAIAQSQPTEAKENDEEDDTTELSEDLKPSVTSGVPLAKGESGVVPAPPRRLVPPPVPGRRPPRISERQKPALPARPGKISTIPDQKDPDSCSNSPSNTAVGTPYSSTNKSTPNSVTVRLKATPPMRPPPVGSKLNALRSGFLNDLNSRLKVALKNTPQANDEPTLIDKETPVATQPLSEIRKERPRGPPGRRKPGVVVAAAAAVVKSETQASEYTNLKDLGAVSHAPEKWEIGKVRTIFEVDENGILKLCSSNDDQEWNKKLKPQLKSSVGPEKNVESNNRPVNEFSMENSRTRHEDSTIDECQGYYTPEDNGPSDNFPDQTLSPNNTDTNNSKTTDHANDGDSNKFSLWTPTEKKNLSKDEVKQWHLFH